MRWKMAAVAAIAVVIAAGSASQIATEFFSRRVADVVNHHVEPALSSRVLFILIDGLRYDIALQSDRFPIARELAAAGASGLCIAEDPTMSGAGVRVIGTGTPPVFSDFVTNMNMPPVTGDHVFSSLARAGQVSAVIGSRSWTQMFGASIAIQETDSGIPSLLARMQPVSRADAAFVKKARRILEARRSTLTVVHLFGSDALSHARGPLSEPYTRKLAELDTQVRELITACGPDCTIVLTSDHGASDRGHHGLGEEIARRTPLVFAGPGIRAGATFTASQRDIAPTLVTILGAPVPGPAQGRVLVEALALDPATSARVTLANAERLAHYTTAHAAEFGGELATPDLAAARAQPDPASMSASADAATTEMLDALRSDRVWRTRWLLIWLPLLLLGAFACVAMTPPGTRSRAAAYAAIAVLVVEIGFVIWRSNATLLRREILESPVIRGLPIGVAGVALCALAAAIAALLARVTRPAEHDRRVLAGLLLVLTAFATSEDLLVFFAIGAFAASLRRARGVTLAIGALGIAAVVASLVFRVPWRVMPPALLVVGCGGGAVALAWWHGRGTLSRRLLVGPLVALGCSTVLHLAGRPDTLTWLYMVASFVAIAGLRVLRIDPVAQRWAIGWSAVGLLLTLSEPTQLPALVGVLAIVAVAATMPKVTALQVALLVLGGRVLILYALEGRFSYSDIEWHVGKVGNPSSKLIGHAVIAAKYALPIVALFGIVGAVTTTRTLVVGGAWALAALLLFMLHSAASLQITAGQYHTPYVDISTLLGAAAIVVSVAIAWLLLGTTRPR